MEEKTNLSTLKGEDRSIGADHAVITDIYRRQVAYKDIARHVSVKERISKIRRLISSVEKHNKELTDAFFDDFRKPASEVDLTEVYPFIKECHTIIRNLHDWVKPNVVGAPITLLGTSSKVVREPRGNILAITPWNYPFNLTFIPVASALAAGNTVIVKPSEYTPKVNKVMHSIISEVFDPAEACIVEGGIETAQFLLKLKFDHIHFTGSSRVGQIIMKAAAEHHTSITLELGGKSPAIVDQTADISTSAKRIVWGKYLNNGQTCIAPDYILVHEDVHDRLVDELIKYIERQFGNGLEAIASSKDLCRLINKEHYDRMCQLTDEAISRGAEVTYGNQRKEEDLYFSPTILLEVDKESDVMNEEIFGPVLPVVKYKNSSEAAAWIRQKDKPLSMYIFSRSKKSIRDFMEGTSAGSTVINHCVLHYIHPELPFGGVNHSGMGKNHGKFAFDEFTYQRAVLQQDWKWSPSDILMPPYTMTVHNMIEILKRWF